MKYARQAVLRLLQRSAGLRPRGGYLTFVGTDGATGIRLCACQHQSSLTIGRPSRRRSAVQLDALGCNTTSRRLMGLDIVEFIMAVEAAFGVEIADADAARI